MGFLTIDLSKSCDLIKKTTLISLGLGEHSHIFGDNKIIDIPYPENLPWYKLFDLFDKNGIKIKCWQFRTSYDTSDWKNKKNLIEDGVCGVILHGMFDLDLDNPEEDYKPSNPYNRKGFLPESKSPILKQRPKKLISRADDIEFIFLSSFCDFLKENGAEFKTGEVIYQGKVYKEAFRIFPSHKVDFISPDCFHPEYYKVVNNLIYKIIGLYGKIFADKPLKYPFAMDRKRHGEMSNEQFYVMTLDMALKMMKTFPRSYDLIDPVFNMTGKWGQLFCKIKERADPLLEKPITLDEVLKEAAQEKKEPTITIAPKEKIEKFKVTKVYKPRMYLESENYSYGLIDGFLGISGGKHHLACLDYVLCDSGRLPKKAWEAPLASWLLSRMCVEMKGKFQLEEEQFNDGGGYAYDFIVKKKGEKDVIGCFQLQAGTAGIQLDCEFSEEINCEDVVKDFTGIFLKEPEKLQKCKVRVHDPEWEDDPDAYEPTPKKNTFDKYGWDGKQFLGADNVWGRSWADYPDRERFKKFEDYMRFSYKKWKEGQKAK